MIQLISTKLSLFWFELLGDVVPNHLLSTDVADLPEQFSAHADYLRGRFMLVKKAQVFPVECIVRGYITGSGWRSYLQNGQICGHQLPEGLLKSQQLESPLFTPSTKADEGHDENISYDTMVEMVGKDHADQLRDLSLRIYSEAAAYASAGGVLIADTKFEFGLIDGQITLIDEVLTPDSSRFWPASDHQPGQEPPSWDKQILRNYLDTLDRDKEPPPPKLPNEVLEKTYSRYQEVLNILFEEEASRWA